MKFKLKLSSKIVGLLMLVIAINISAMVIDILILVQTKETLSITAVLSLVVSSLLLIISGSILLNTNYKIKNDKLYVIFGFYPVIININNIKEIFEDIKTRDLCIGYFDKKAKSKEYFNFLSINIDKAFNDDFIKSLMDKNNAIKFNSVDSDKIDKKP